MTCPRTAVRIRDCRTEIEAGFEGVLDATGVGLLEPVMSRLEQEGRPVLLVMTLVTVSAEGASGLRALEQRILEAGGRLQVQAGDGGSRGLLVQAGLSGLLGPGAP